MTIANMFKETNIPSWSTPRINESLANTQASTSHGGSWQLLDIKPQIGQGPSSRIPLLYTHNPVGLLPGPSSSTLLPQSYGFTPSLKFPITSPFEQNPLHLVPTSNQANIKLNRSPNHLQYPSTSHTSERSPSTSYTSERFSFTSKNQDAITSTPSSYSIEQANLLRKSPARKQVQRKLVAKGHLPQGATTRQIRVEELVNIPVSQDSFYSSADHAYLYLQVRY